MRPLLLEVLRCLLCRGHLTLQVQEMRGEHVWAGELRCEECERGWPVVQGVPRFVRSGDPLFERQWERHPDFDSGLVGAGLDDWLGVAPAEVRGSMVLDLGCGTGGLTVATAGQGASLVVGLDATGVVECALGRSAHHANLEFVQADLLDPPFEDGRFDIVYSVGVMHHLSAPSAGVQRAATLVKPGGILAIWVYGRDGTRLVRLGRRALARWLDPRLPDRTLGWRVDLIARVLTFVALVIDHLPRAIAKSLPLAQYLRYFREQSPRRRVGIVYDHVTAQVVRYSGPATVRGWLEGAGLTDVRLEARHGTGWKARGRRPGPAIH